MAAKIGSQNGIEGTRLRLQTLDPQETDVPAYNRLLGKPGTVYPGDALPAEGTLAKLVDGHNEFDARIAGLEAAFNALPFPVSS